MRVAFNNAYRRILDLPWRCSASGVYATYGINNLEAITRKQTFGFIGRLRKSCNTIVQTLENAWIIRIQLWHTWFDNDNDNDNEIDLFRHHNGNNTNIKVIFKQMTMLDKCNCI